MAKPSPLCLAVVCSTGPARRPVQIGAALIAPDQVGAVVNLSRSRSRIVLVGDDNEWIDVDVSVAEVAKALSVDFTAESV